MYAMGNFKHKDGQSVQEYTSEFHFKDDQMEKAMQD